MKATIPRHFSGQLPITQLWDITDIRQTDPTSDPSRLFYCIGKGAHPCRGPSKGMQYDQPPTMMGRYSYGQDHLHVAVPSSVYQLNHIFGVPLG
jgi:hypothetical protein